HGRAMRRSSWRATVLEAAGVTGTPGVVSEGTAAATLTAVQALLGAHRVWERFPAAIA
ncbi:hypothetical protein AB0M20_29730, partial [Actinoplanes sp. NPDC051633]|uniref:hypothetical protein n=1 Tax=Actinoplanes sp. NPDC051633 TaxID=3155670 RepID=UPI0034205277